MWYMGSKNRIARHILPIILKDRVEGQTYAEPFVGGGNIIDKVVGLRIGADYNEHAVAALELIRDDPESLPASVSEKEYKEARGYKHKGLKGYIGFTVSFGSKFFGGYARGSGLRRFFLPPLRSFARSYPGLQGVNLFWLSYEDLDLVLPKNSIIYCDPPYKGTTKYKTGAFDHEAFWLWAQRMANEGHTVFVSGYNGPEWAVVVWEKEINSNLSNLVACNRATEKLFRVYPTDKDIDELLM